MASNGPTPPPGSLPAGLRGRRGGIATRGNRLPSLRSPRDLTLGGSQKRSFTPNIPARRDKVKTEPGESSESKATDHQGNKGSQRGRGRGGRGSDRGRGRGRGEIIQSRSIFEEGPAQGTNARKGLGGDGYERSAASGPASTARTSGIKKEKKEPSDDAQLLKDLMQDDFIADHAAGTDPNMSPTVLPLGFHKLKLEAKQEAKPEVKVKEEPGLEDDKSSVQSVSTSSSPIFISSSTVNTPAELFTKAPLTATENGELLFFQLPDTLPGDPPDKDDGPSTSHGKKDRTKEQDSLTKRLGMCSLNDFAEGHIGKLRIHRSGRTTLLLGNTVLDVSMGTPAGFLQEVVSIETNQTSGEMTVLGEVKHKFLCVPDFECMLDQQGT